MSPFSANFRLPGNRKARTRRARLAGQTGITLSVVLLASLLPVQAWAAPPGDRVGVQLPGLQKDLQAQLDEVAAAKLKGWSGTAALPPPPYAPKEETPPKGAGTVDLQPTAGDALVPVGSLPVSIGKATGSDTVPSGTWSVSVEDRAATEAASIDGAIIKITPPVGGATPVDVALDYAKFKDLYGTEWATRLQLKQFPACFLDTPQLPECTIGRDIPNTADSSGKKIRATVDPAASPDPGMRMMSGGGGSVVVAATDGGAGAGGSYKATSLSPSGSWSAGGSGGGFSWTYPLTVPAPPAGPAPKVAFSYSSQAVDGKTSVANGQASWIGDGWDYEPGYIERRYRSCADDRKASPGTPNNDNAVDKKKGDLCWAGDNVAMSLGGSTTELVRDEKTGRWVPASDDGSRIEHKTDPATVNGAKDGEYWIVTTREGTRYFFGRHDVDGSGSRPVTNSVLTVPVFGNHLGEPCHQVGKFASSGCTQGWRWNLDYVEDVHGNAMIIDWARETNRYAKDMKFKASVEYSRAGYPTQISYGLRNDDLSAVPAAKVLFGVDERCIEEGAVRCGNDQFASKNYQDKQPWWDTPSTLNCKQGTDCFTGSPTFWTRKRLTSVTTVAQRTPGSTELSKVDQWSLSQSFPVQRTDTHPPLWLESILRTGYGTGKDDNGEQLSKPLPPVSFGANEVDMPNRVAKGIDPKTNKPDPVPDFDRLRLETIRTETGGEIYVDYSAPCAAGTTHPQPEANTTRCYPVHWSSDGDVEKPPLEWFNKYVVDKVIEKDRVARQPDITTSYTYEGDAAWAKDSDEFSKPELRTYSQWRGYASVLVKKGVTANAGKADATEQSQTRTRYFRGMSADAGRPKITVKDSTGTQELGEDFPRYQGRVAETITYTKAGGSVYGRSLTWPWYEQDPQASRPRADNTPLEAFRSGTARTDRIQTISGGATRTFRTINTYETTYGLSEKVQTEAVSPDGTGGEKTTDQTCAKTSYVHNPAKHLIGLSAGVRTTAGDCATAGALIADSRTSYDALDAFGTAPTKGLVYQVDTNDAAGTGWITTGRTEYDKLGRPIKVTDAANNPVTTTFSPATGPVFTVTSTNPLGFTTSTTSDPGRDVPLQDTDANNRKVTTAYDELGRTTAVWTSSQNPDTDKKAAFTFDYQIAEGHPPVVTSRTLQDDGTYTQALTIYDGLLRHRQSQGEAPGGGRLITDTLYSANGTVRQTNNGYYAEGDPTNTIFVPETVFHVPNSTKTAYDGLGRGIRTTTLHADVPQYSTTAQYGGDWTLSRSAMSADGTTPLKGSRASKTWTDPLGRTSAIEHATATDLTTWNKTSYTYDLRNKLTTVTDTALNKWTYTYDARGRMTSSDDPDAGRTSSTYNNLDQPVSTTDAQGRLQFTKYDALGRQTELRADAENGSLVSTWSYDTLPNAKGQPVAATRYTGGKAYTSEVTGYDAEYRPTGSKITIPTTTDDATKGLAGTYNYSTTYTPTGKVQSTTVPATTGGLAAEKLITRYNKDGLAKSLSGLDWYTADTIYSSFGHIQRTASGSAPKRLWTTNIYNPNTGQLTQAQTHKEQFTQGTDSPLIGDVSYAYDTAGNITSVSDKRADGGIDRQCYAYDPMGQLTKAWTGKTSACSGPSLTDVTAGPDGDGFWQEYQFDKIGNRTKLLNRDLTDGALDDETTYSYGVTIAGNGTQPPVTTKPHALAKAEKTTREVGKTVVSQSTYTYDAAGNTKTRRIDGDTQTLGWDRRNKLVDASSPGIGAVQVTGLAGKCLDVEGGSPADNTPVQLLTCDASKAQQWRLTDNTVQALGKCLTADNGEARLAKCDGSERQKFTYNSEDKTLYSTVAKACLTVPNDNPAEGNDLDIYTCVAGAASQQWNAASAATKYLYDAGGNRLIEETGSTRTLYLGEAEITVNKAGQAMDAVRYYSGPGPTTVRRTNGKTTGHKLSLLLTDHHNTATITVDQSSASQAVTRRKSDPYGNPRGSEPGNWPGNRSFLGSGIDDTDTGLTHIGAREYEPTTGRFISVDPIIDITDPLQMNGYTYANGNPITGSDPTGLKADNCAYSSRCTANGGPIDQKNYDVLGGAGGGSDESGSEWTGGKTSQGSTQSKGNKGSSGGTKTSGKKECGWSFKCHTKKAVKATTEWVKENKVAIVAITVEVVVGAACIGGAVAAGAATGGVGFALAAGCGAVAGAAGAAVTNAMTPGADHSVMGVLKDIAIGGAVGAAGGVLGVAAGVAAKAASKVIGKGVSSLLAKVRPKTGCPVPNSFAAGTLVLMADGSTKAINELQPGDKVLATDPETGQTVDKDVSATILGEGVKDLVEITITADDGTPTEPITATDGHPFWVADLARWVDATDLEPGQWLQTENGTRVQVAAVKRWESPQTTVYNLTVTDLHTYYVLVGTTAVLVHNCNGRLVSNGTAASATVTPQSLLDDAKALHDTFGVGTRADKGTTVATGQLGGELVYSVANNGTNRSLRALASKLGYRRVYETDLTPQVHSDAEQILFNSIDEAEHAADGIIASSRPACGPSRQNCAGRANDYPGVQLWERGR
ncbi:ricin-type beta-trefoil lectin domain protein [Streptomyces sp. NPDC058612]|uniref:ricin-type beta-trefoil lectin domain protein n=1 Tax=Streptomyces sp. NPDC058612 TaxID=3346555 RepID=UPI0036529299